MKITQMIWTTGLRLNEIKFHNAILGNGTKNLLWFF